MKKTGIFYGSTTGNTEMVAKAIAKKLNAECVDVSQSSVEELEGYDNLILGTSTLGLGDLQDDWEDFVVDLSQAKLDGKTVALFGLGDSAAYPDTFVDAMGTLYDTVKDKGCSLVGEVGTDGYDFDDSTALIDGKFVGLPLDEDNESDLTEERITNWIEKISPALV